MSQYLISFNDEWVPEHTHEQLLAKAVAGRAVVAEMEAAGVFLFSNGGLDRSSIIGSVEAVDGEPIFSDGPFAETKEHLGGFLVLDVPDDVTALEWAGKLAVALDWPQDVHRFPQPPDRPDAD